MTKGLFASVTLFVVFLVGCEGVPQLASPTVRTMESEGVVTNQGRGGYDWNVVGGAFEVAMQSELSVFSGLDIDRIRQSVPPLVYAEPTVPNRPDGMKDKTYRIYSRFVEPYFDTQPFLTIPFKAADKGMFSINVIGDRLALINGQLQIWDLAQSKMLHEFPLPTQSSKAVIWGHDQEHVIVMDQQGLTSFSVASGQPTYHWDAADSDFPIQCVHAGKTPNYAVLTENGALVVLDHELRASNTYTGRPLKQSLISIHPNGSSVDAMLGRELIRWNFSDSGQSDIETLAKLDDKYELTGLITGCNFSYLISPFDLYTITSAQNSVATRFQINRAIHAACMGTVDFSDDFLSCCQSRRNSQGSYDYFLQDYFLGDGSSSFEFPLGNEPVLEMASNRNTETFGIRDKDSLKFFRRQRWKIVDADWSARDVLSLVKDGDLEQAELLTKEIGKLPRTRSMPGYSYAALVAETIGYYWAELEWSELHRSRQASKENAPKQESQLIMLKNWVESGSELAAIASANRHYIVGQWSRGVGTAPAAAPMDWGRYEERIEMAREAISSLLTKEKPPCGAIRLAIQIGLHQFKTTEDFFPLVDKLLNHYIFDFTSHVWFCSHLYEKPGEAGAYLTSVAELLPQIQADILYAKVAMRFYNLNNKENVFISSAGGLSKGRVMRAVDSLINERALWTHEAETLMTMLQNTMTDDLAIKIAKSNLENFSVCPKFRTAPIFKSERDKFLKLNFPK